MARKGFIATDAMREKVTYLAGVGVPQDDIAKIIGCAPKTLRKRFGAELDRGVAEANATMAGYLFNAAKAGNITAMIFWLKTRAHWRVRPAMSQDGAEPQSNAPEPTLIILPDSGLGLPMEDGLVEALVTAQDRYYQKKERQEQRKRARASL